MSAALSRERLVFRDLARQDLVLWHVYVGGRADATLDQTLQCAT